MLREKDGRPVDLTAIRAEDRRLEKRRDDFLMGPPSPGFGATRTVRSSAWFDALTTGSG